MNTMARMVALTAMLATAAVMVIYAIGYIYNQEVRTPDYKVGQIWYEVQGNPWEAITNTYEVLAVQGEWTRVSVTWYGMNRGFVSHRRGNWTRFNGLVLDTSPRTPVVVTNTITATQWVYCVDRVVTQTAERTVPYARWLITNDVFIAETNGLVIAETNGLSPEH